MTTPRLLFVGTHHKTGTVWMRRTFHRHARAHGIPVVRVNGSTRAEDLPKDGPALLVNWASEVPRDILDRPDTRALHVIRDPRDVLISGMHHHLGAKTDKEKWLARPNPDWGGKSYQDMITGLKNPLDRMRFEMHGKHKQTLTQMRGWEYGHAHAVDLRIEDLRTDTDSTRFRHAVTQLAVDGFDPDGVTQAFHAEARFGGASGGAKTQTTPLWPDQMPLEIAVEYNTAFGADLNHLGYATQGDWVDTCRPAAAP